MSKKDKVEKKPVDVRRKFYKSLTIGFLGMISVIILAACWYSLYTGIMPALNTFMFGYVGGANVFDTIEKDVIPYSMIALWAIPSLFMCGTLNVLLWKFTKLWIRGTKKVYGFLLNKFDETTAKVKAEKESKK